MLAPAFAQETPRITLDTSQTMFSVLAAINTCGYDQDLSQSLPIRSEIRSEVLKAAQSPQAQDALQSLCAFYSDHKLPDPSHQLAQYVSLGLNLSNPPVFSLRVKEADLPPDATYVLGFVPLLQNFAVTTELSEIWKRHRGDYDELIREFHEPISNMLLATDMYLKQPSRYTSSRFVVYLDPLAAPSQVNSRNYGEDYYVVVSPDAAGIRLDQIRHAYLHYLIDPMIGGRTQAMQRLAPLLDVVKTAPMNEAYKSDTSLLVTECLIRAIEAHLLGGSKGPEAPQLKAVDTAMHEGFILTRYFYDQLTQFEKTPEGLRNSVGDFLYYINVPDEVKRATRIEWAATATAEPESLQSLTNKGTLVRLAERALAAGNLAGARNFATQAMQRNEEPGRALFVLARVATFSGDITGARKYFELTLKNSSDPKILAWSNIYLGRISDLQGNRQAALESYQAALKAGDSSPEIKTAAEHGLKEPYAPPVQRKK